MPDRRVVGGLGGSIVAGARNVPRDEFVYLRSLLGDAEA